MYRQTALRKEQKTSPFLNSKENMESVSNYEDHLKESISTRQPTLSADNLYITRLQSKILQMQKRIDQQHFQINSLTAQAEHFTKACDEQKRQLSKHNVQILRQEYQQQISQLGRQKGKVQELICSISEEYQLTEKQQSQQLQLMKTKNMHLAGQIEIALQQKYLLLKQIEETDLQHRSTLAVLAEQEERIEELRNIERKWLLAIRQLEVLQGKK